MTIAELHAQLTELCNKGHGGAKILWGDAEVVEHATLTKAQIECQPENGGKVLYDFEAEYLGLAHGETFLMLE